jgi:hypothetical protein
MTSSTKKAKKSTKKSVKKVVAPKKVVKEEIVNEDESGGQRFTTFWRNKWLTSEAKTIEDMVDSLRAAADSLEQMAKDGIVLEDDGAVADDYATLVTTNSAIAAKYGLDLEECEDEDGCGDDLN